MNFDHVSVGESRGRYFTPSISKKASAYPMPTRRTVAKSNCRGGGPTQHLHEEGQGRTQGGCQAVAFACNADGILALVDRVQHGTSHVAVQT